MTPRRPLTVRRTLVAFASALVAVLPFFPGHACGAEVKISAVRMGFNGLYKLGCWTQLVVALENGKFPEHARIEAILPDTDGVPTTVSVPLESRQLKPGGTTAAALIVRNGQHGAPLTIRAVNEAGETLATHTFVPDRAGEGSELSAGLPATNKLVVTFGAGVDLAADLARMDQPASPAVAARSVLVDSALVLPTAWYGYEGVDTVVLSGAKPQQYEPRDEVAPRIAALARWVELGGRVVIFCGATADQLLGAGGPLAPLVPGRFTGEFEQLLESTPLEIFAGAAVPLRRTEVRLIRVPQLVDVQGEQLAQGAGQLPLAVRARRGLGEITFVALDPEAEPFAGWSDRTGLLRQALAWPAPAPTASASRGFVGPAAADLTNQLRTALDQQFTGVQTVSFATVALLVIGYIALIGPGDYFFLRRALKRMELTWLTFPLLILGTSAAAYALAHRSKGEALRANQLEIVDVDVARGEARGTLWTHVFNPRVARYDFALVARFAGNEAGDWRLEAGGAGDSTDVSEQPGEARAAGPVPSPSLQPPASSLQPLVSWLGVPGPGLGAMQGQRGLGSPFARGYEFADNLATLDGVPIEQWSTKSLTARWTAHVGPTIEAELRVRGGELLAGQLTNRTPVRLEDCVLMHRGWAFTLPPLDPGAVAVIDDSLAPRTIKTTLTSRAAGDDPQVRVAEDGTVLFDGLSTDVARIAKLMMFFETIGGEAYAGVPHRYQSFVDLSRLTRGDQAILLARAPADAGSYWTLTDGAQEGESREADPLIDDANRRWTYYRFVLPIETAAAPQRAAGPAVPAEAAEPDAPPTEDAEESPAMGPPVYGPSVLPPEE